MERVNIFDTEVDPKNPERGIQEILTNIRPAWQASDVEIKVTSRHLIISTSYLNMLLYIR